MVKKKFGHLKLIPIFGVLRKENYCIMIRNFNYLCVVGGSRQQLLSYDSNFLLSSLGFSGFPEKLFLCL